MRYTVKQLGPELAGIYTAYLQLTEELRLGADGDSEAARISGVEAIRRAEKLEVQDLYGATWKINPLTGTFVMIDDKGARIENADPKRFQPRRPYQDSDLEDIPQFDFNDKPDSSAVATLRRRKMPWWAVTLIVVGALVAGVAAFGGGFLTGAKATSSAEVEVTEDPRPVLAEGEGPTAERTQEVLTELSTGRASRMSYVVDDMTDEDIVRWSQAVYGTLMSNGYRLVEVRVDGISILQILNDRDEVLMQGDMEWMQNSRGEWLLAELPLMSVTNYPAAAVDVEVPTDEEPGSEDAPESETPEPEDEESAE